jgi:hypothetical protein
MQKNHRSQPQNPIIATDYTGGRRILVHRTTGIPVHHGEELSRSPDEVVLCTGGEAPHKPGVDGRVYFTRSRDGSKPFSARAYVGCYGLCWVECEGSRKAETDLISIGWLDADGFEFEKQFSSARSARDWVKHHPRTLDLLWSCCITGEVIIGDLTQFDDDACDRVDSIALDFLQHKNKFLSNDDPLF